MALTGILPFVPLKETHYEVFLPLSIKRLDTQQYQVGAIIAKHERLSNLLSIMSNVSQRLRLVQQGTLSTRDKLLFWFVDTFLVWRPLVSHLRKRGIHVC
jgi:hypothetical protein